MNKQWVYLFQYKKSRVKIDSLYYDSLKNLVFRYKHISEHLYGIEFEKELAQIRVPIYNENPKIFLDLHYAKNPSQMANNIIFSNSKMAYDFNYVRKTRNLTRDRIKKFKSDIDNLQSKNNNIEKFFLDSIMKYYYEVSISNKSKNVAYDAWVAITSLSHEYPYLQDKVDSLFEYFCESIYERFPEEKIEKTMTRKGLDNVLIPINNSVILNSFFKDFILPNNKGKLIKLSNYKGKYILLSFWASWCKPCREENPLLKDIYKKYKNKKFIIFSVSVDKNKENWLKIIKKDKIEKWIHTIEKTDDGQKNIQKNYDFTTLPSNFLINPEGKIIAIDLRGEALDKKLQEIFKK